MISLPECVKNINQGKDLNCAEFLNKSSSTQINYIVEISWIFNLTFGKNVFNLSQDTNASQIGFMLLYSIENSLNSGRIALDTTEGSISDFKMFSHSQTLAGPLDQTKKYRFSVSLTINPVQKFFNKMVSKIYAYPGAYYINAWLEGEGPFFIKKIDVVDGKL